MPENTTTETIARRIAQVREERGIGVRELGRLTGAHIWRIESGQHSPSIETLEKIANALDVEIEDLLK